VSIFTQATRMPFRIVRGISRWLDVGDRWLVWYAPLFAAALVGGAILVVS
jgi:hypothetical protein